MTQNSINLSAFPNASRQNGYGLSMDQQHLNEGYIFEYHNVYRRQFPTNETICQEQNIQNPDERSHHLLRYSYNATENFETVPRNSVLNKTLPRSTSAFEYGPSDDSGSRGGNYYGHHQYHPTQLPHSISLDTWEREHVYKQHKMLANLYSKINLSRNQLVEIEHATLAAEEKYRTLMKVAKNPTEEDCFILDSEVVELQRSLQSLYDECEQLNVDIPGESPVSCTSQLPQFPGTRELLQVPFQHEQSWRSGYNTPQDPIDSPSRLLLLNPHDDSLSTPMSQW